MCEKRQHPMNRRFRMRRSRAGICTILLTIILSLSLVFAPGQSFGAAAAKTLDPDADSVISGVRSYILQHDTNPDYSSGWNIIGISRSGTGLPSGYRNKYYNNTIYELKSMGWDYRTNRYSDYSKLIIGMTAIGVDATRVDGHNLFSYLSDFKNIKKQGFNGPVWALIALNVHPSYKIPKNTKAKEQTTEEGLIQFLLQNGGTSQGGWTLYGDTPDADITAMTIQALAPYYHERQDVRSRVDKALKWLSSDQLNSGGFATLNGTSKVETSESTSQVMVALTALGIDPAQDSRFVKSSGKWPMSRLFEYLKPSGKNYGFMHVQAGGRSNGGGAAGNIDGMATEQGMYATVAYKRLLAGQTALFDMSDISLKAGKAPAAPAKSAASSAKKTSKVKVSKITLNKNRIFLKKGQTAVLKAGVKPAKATKKKVKWVSSDSEIATVSQKGKIKALKPGTVVITAKATDGSGVKSICKVIISSSSQTGSRGNSSGNNNNNNNSNNSKNSKNNKKTSNSSRKSGSSNSSSASSTTAYYPSSSYNTDPADTSENEDESEKDEEESTEAGAWSFNGSDYKPDSDNEIPQADLTDDEYDFSEEESTSQDGLSDSDENGDNAGRGGLNIPVWVQILLGILIPAGTILALTAPWAKNRDKKKNQIRNRKRDKSRDKNRFKNRDMKKD